MYTRGTIYVGTVGRGTHFVIHLPIMRVGTEGPDGHDIKYRKSPYSFDDDSPSTVEMLERNGVGRLSCIHGRRRCQALKFSMERNWIW